VKRQGGQLESSCYTTLSSFEDCAGIATDERDGKFGDEKRYNEKLMCFSES
jgi:hypothetical protein